MFGIIKRIIDRKWERKVEEVLPTLKALIKTHKMGYKSRSIDRLWIDGGCEQGVKIAESLGLVIVDKATGHYIIGPPSDMVQLTPYGVQIASKYNLS